MSAELASGLQPALHQAHLPFIALDHAGCLVALNAAAADLFGRPIDRLIGACFVDLLDPFSREKASLMLSQALAEGSAHDWELNHFQPGAAPLLVSYTAWSWRPTPEALPGIAALGQPLSAALSLAEQLAATNQQLEGALLQLERAHAALKEAQAQLVRSEKMRALGQLVAGVAHEVNTPLGYVVNNLALLDERLGHLRELHVAYHRHAANIPELAAQLQAADEAIGITQIWDDLDEILPESCEGLARITAIIQDLRSFARPDNPGLQVVNLNASLAGTVRIARSLANESVQIAECYGPVPPIVCCPGQVSQIVLNLLTNAVQAVGGVGEVAISTSREDGWAVITVSDTGVGMDETTLARLGEPFFTTRPLGTGTGLGIAISRGIAARHGGRVEFSSAPGCGTSARLFLPIDGPPAVMGTA